MFRFLSKGSSKKTPFDREIERLMDVFTLYIVYSKDSLT